MKLYKVTYGNGVKDLIRARDPKQAYEIASKVGEVAHIKCVSVNK